MTIRVQRTMCGDWEVVLSDGHAGITCETLDDARRIAYLAVAHTQACELIVHDAHDHILHRELIDANPGRVVEVAIPMVR